MSDMEKTSKEYAEKLAKEYAKDLALKETDFYEDYAKMDFTQGYLKAIEETNAKELYEAIGNLMDRIDNIEHEDFDWINFKSISSEVDRIREALNKSK